MKKLYNTILTIALVVSAFGATAQITIDPNPVYLDDIDITTFDIVAYGSITNDADVAKTFTWNRTELEITDGWETAICDPNVCYGYESNVPDDYFTLQPGESDTWDFHLYPFNTEGAAIVRVIVSEVGNFSNNQTAMYYFNQFVGVAEVLDEAIKIFPNPATDVIRIENGYEVQQLEMFDLTGKKVMETTVNNSNTIAVNHLPAGTYIARLFDNSGAQVSSNVLIKK